MTLDFLITGYKEVLLVKHHPVKLYVRISRL